MKHTKRRNLFDLVLRHRDVYERRNFTFGGSLLLPIMSGSRRYRPVHEVSSFICFPFESFAPATGSRVAWAAAVAFSKRSALTWKSFSAPTLNNWILVFFLDAGLAFTK